jgi:hypothetical protein
MSIHNCLGEEKSYIRRMRIQELHELRDATPFRPFVIRTADGHSVPVHHHDLMISAPNGRTVIVYQPDSSFDIVDVMLVTSLRMKSPNGRSSHKK